MAANAIRSVIRSDASLRTIPVARHRLPVTGELSPYLARIDDLRWRSSAGPLLREFEARLAGRFDEPTTVTTFANSASAIAAALRALDCRPGGLCAMPAWTATTTAHAVRQADLEPWLLDVDPDTWMLDPTSTLQALQTAPGPVDAILPAAAFGRLPDLATWAEIARSAGTPVLVDAAGAFDAAAAAPVPIVVGLGPGDAVSTAGGGFLASEDAGFIERVRALAAVDGGGAASDAALSDYSAATGLASLDAWPETRRRLAYAAQQLRVALALTPQITFQPGWGDRWLSSACVVEVPAGAAASMAASLAARGVETRAWWVDGCHTDPGFAGCLRQSAPVTAHLAASTLGLPFFTDLDEPTSWRIVDALIEALKEI